MPQTNTHYIMWSYADLWESSSHSHPRRGLGFMDEAAEDISCNIMPKPLPAPYPVSSPRAPSPPRPPHFLSRTQSTHRHEILFFFFFSHDNIFFLLLEKKKRKPAGRVVVANLVGAWEKKRGYRLHKWAACMYKNQTKYRIWAVVAEQALPVFVLFECGYSDVGWG